MQTLFATYLKNHRSLSHTRRTIDLKNCGDTGDGCGRTGNAFGVVLFQSVRTSALNKWRREKSFPRELKDLIGIGNNFYARKLFLLIKLPFMCEWVYSGT